MRYIDADKTLKAITSQFDDCVCIADVIYVFDNQPTADVRENVRGEWKIYCDENGKVTDCYCNQCGCNSFIGGNFCPNCGADMRTD